jgi:DNA-binding transcriptional LysR family regulator
MNLNHLRTFALVGTHLNLSRVADMLKTTQATITRQIQSIETNLGVKLVTTTPRGARLTEEGATFLVFAKKIIIQIDDMQQEICENKDNLSGELRVITTRFGSYFLAEHLEEFRQKYPSIHLYVDSDTINQLPRGSEIAGTFLGLTTAPPPVNTPLVWQKLNTYSYFPFAGKKYVDKFGLPKTYDELDQHRFIGYKWSADFSHIDHKGSNPFLYQTRLDSDPREPYVVVNDIEVCRAMIEEGIGIGMLPKFLANNESFVPVLPDIFSPELSVTRTIYYVIKENLKSNARVRALINFFKEKAAMNTPAPTVATKELVG